jgi:hypothetical protein
MTDGLDDAAEVAAEHVAASAADPSAPGARARPSRKATLRPDVEDGLCANCQTELKGAVCHHCGQLDDEFHRPVRGLLGEIIEGLFALDGRVARTIPNLLLRPGRVTRAYLMGQRARFMPPFRLYIIASLIFFLLVPALTSLFTADDAERLREAVTTGSVEAQLEEAARSGDLTPEQVAETRAALERAGLGELFDVRESEAANSLTPPGSNSDQGDERASAGEPEAGDAAASDPDGDRPDSAQGPGVTLGGDTGEALAQSIRRFMVPEDFGGQAPDGTGSYAVRSFFAERFARVAEDPARWLERAANWVPRIMFAMVPLYALLLSATYAWRRGFFLYDHLIVSVHFHAALFLALTLFYILGYIIPGGLVFLLILIYSNAYLYRLHRVVYGRGRISSALRTITLDIVYAIFLTFGLLATLILGALVG